jgi:aquaporin Z
MKPYLAEFVGTFVLVFLGSAAVALAPAQTGPLIPAFAHGLAIVFGAYAFGAISGAHFNPAVTISLLIARAIEPLKATIYILNQVLGAVTAALMLNFILSGQAENFGAFSFTTSVESAFLLEAILTFILATVVLQAAVAGKAGNLAGLSIGLTLAACILAGGPLTGASLNPARTLGPAIVAGELGQAWVYVLATIVGGAIAALLYRFVWSAKKVRRPHRYWKICLFAAIHDIHAVFLSNARQFSIFPG